MKIYYIASETQNSLSKAERWNSFDKRMILKKCWLSFVSNLTIEDSIDVFYNNIKDSTIDWMKTSCNHLINFYKSESLEENFKCLANTIKTDIEKEQNKDSLFSIVEDDYLWSPGSLIYLKQTFQYWDKFIVPNDTMINYRKPMFSKVLLGTDRYWKTSNAITWTLLGKQHKWKEHLSVIEKSLNTIDLNNYNSLTLNDYCINPLPAVASHLRQNDLSPYVDWSDIWERIKI